MNLTKIIDFEKSKGFFDCSKGDKMQGFALENSFLYEGVELGVDYFLGNSEEECYDFEKYNKTYNNKKDYVVMGVLLGGDTFGYYKGGKDIYIYLDTESNVDGEVFAPVAENLEKFISMAFKD